MLFGPAQERNFLTVSSFLCCPLTSWIEMVSDVTPCCLKQTFGSQQNEKVKSQIMYPLNLDQREDEGVFCNVTYL